MSEPHHKPAASTPNAPGLKLQRQGRVDGATHARSGNHNQTLSREAQTGPHGPVCVSFPRLAKQSESDELQTNQFEPPTLRQLSDPPCPDFKQVVSRVRELAAEALEVHGVRCSFVVPSDLERVKFTSQDCDHLFLIFREALQNISHHARCANATFSISVTEPALVIGIRDDGRGLFGKVTGRLVSSERRGQGLREMQARVMELGGMLEISSAPERGTSLTLTIPLRPSDAS